MKQPSFFNTQNQSGQIHKAAFNLDKYTSKLDVHIEKALKTQNNIVARKRKDLLHQLELIKEKTMKQTMKVRKMEEYFVKYCESVLEKDIDKWKNNDDFFKELFKHYEDKIQAQKVANREKKEEIRRKTAELKERMKEIKKQQAIKLNFKTDEMWFQMSKKKSVKSFKSSSKTRIKTDCSLPSLPKNIEESARKRYMQPIKKMKTENESQSINLIIEMLRWYKGKKPASNLFQRMLWKEENIVKLEGQLRNERELNSIRSYTEM